MSKILVIDDSLDLRQMLKEFFESFDHHVLEAASGREGLEVISEENPDLLITDIIMPDMNGVDMMKALRAHNKRLPVIVLSGFEGELAAIKRLGVFACMTKPPNMSELKQLVEIITDKLSA